MAGYPFVVSEHRGVGPVHYDVIIGTGPRCHTWRFERGTRGWHGRRIADHRRRYLTWSGPISGNRGTVMVRATSRAYGHFSRHGTILHVRPNPLVCFGYGAPIGSCFQQRGNRVVAVISHASIPVL